MRLYILLLLVPGILSRNPISAEGPNLKAMKTLEDRLVSGLTEYMQTGHESSDLQLAFQMVHSPRVFRSFEDTKSRPMVCILCNVAARMLLGYKESGVSVEAVKDGLKKLCTNAQIESATVCNGVIDLNAGIFIYIIDHKPDLNADKICSVIAQPGGCPTPPEEDNWEVQIPPVLQKPSKLRDVFRASDEKPVRILQITDIHYDELYTVGGNAECGEPLCCGSNQGTPATPEAAAGTWGDYRSCDMPWYTVENLMKQVVQHDFDFMYYTGDVINHRVWATSIKDNIKNIKKLYGEFRKTFTNIPVFPILGNHEPNPLNEYAPTNVTETDLTTQWLYDTIAEEWSQWLPESTKETIKRGGYYTVVVRPGFRIIALNSNVAYTFNWWLLYDHSILQEQLQWLVNTLSEAEKNNEIVHILSHVPTGDNTCLIKWSREYKRIMNRFSHVIAAQFVGHTHYDEMNLFFKDSNIDEPIGVVYNGGSFTTFVNVNPNYVLYEINSQTLEVENYDQWIYNLTEANKNSVNVSPTWFKLYSFKEEYGLKSMKLAELANLVKNMAKNQTLLDQYYRNKMRAGDPALLKGCDQDCHEMNICNLVTTQFGDDKLCNELTTEYRTTLTKQ